MKRLRKGRPMLYKKRMGRLQWKQGHSREAGIMVKGTNRRVIVVRSPDPKIFDEAIFILKEDYLKRGGSVEDVLEEARRAAGDYLRKNATRSRPCRGRLSPRWWAAAVAAVGCAAWLTVRLVGV